MVRIASIVVALHGLVHLIGFVVPWRITDIEGFAYRTTALDGLLVLGEAGARGLGLVWLALALGFVVGGIGVARGAGWAAPLTAGLAIGSIGVCLLGLPETIAGIGVNAGILAAVGYVTIHPRGKAANLR